MKLLSWALQKTVEPPVTMNLITVLALAACIRPAAAPLLGAGFVAIMAAANCATVAARLWQSQRKQASETEFARWFAPPTNHTLVFQDGWWHIEPNPRQSAAASMHDALTTRQSPTPVAGENPPLPLV